MHTHDPVMRRGPRARTAAPRPGVRVRPRDKTDPCKKPDPSRWRWRRSERISRALKRRRRARGAAIVLPLGTARMRSGATPVLCI
jgi:hypothetical protein